MKEFIKKHKTKFLMIVCALFGGTVVASAETVATIFSSSEVSYSNEDMDATNVQDAIDELHEKIPLTAKHKVQKLNVSISTSGDGLYVDGAEENRYIYKGTNPNNYITFNGETAGWRIVSIESDGTIKIIRTASIGNKEWDEKSTRNSSTSKYCQNSPNYGCNAWAKTSSLKSIDSTFLPELANEKYYQYYPNGGTSGTAYSGTVTQDSSLNTYLNEDYYSNTLKSNSNIDKHNFNISTPGNYEDTESITTDVAQEKLYTWSGYVGLITATDYIRTTTNSACNSLKKAYGSSNKSNCGTNNWLNNTSTYWTISPLVAYNSYNVWLVHSEGYLDNNSASYNGPNLRPVVFIKANVNIKGNGTSDSPYYIDE